MASKTYIIVHHWGGLKNHPNYDSSDKTFNELNNAHRWAYGMKSQLGFYCGYHYFINKAGKIYQARTESDVGAHCKGMNTTSIGICLAGNFSRPTNLPNNMPTPEQIVSLKKLLEEIVKRQGIKLNKIVPHRFFGSTQCYGVNLPNDWARDLAVGNLKELIKLQISIIQKILGLLFRLLDKVKVGRVYQ